MLWGDRRAGERPSAIRRFLDRHLWLLLLSAVGAGFGCGALAAYLAGLNPSRPHYQDWTAGLFVVPALAMGWLAVRVPGSAGALAYLSSVGGHLLVAYLADDGFNLPEYRAWVIVGMTMGPLLGYLGGRLRSPSAVTRVFAAGFPLGVMAVFLVFATGMASDSAWEDHLHPVVLGVEAGLALVVLALCRGWFSRFNALLTSVALLFPMVFGLGALFALAWWASGDW